MIKLLFFIAMGILCNESQENKLIDHSSQDESVSNSYWVDLAVNRGSYAELIKGFSWEDKILVAEDSELSNNYRSMNRMLYDAMQYIFGEGIDYQFFNKILEDKRREVAYLRETLKYTREDHACEFSLSLDDHPTYFGLSIDLTQYHELSRFIFLYKKYTYGKKERLQTIPNSMDTLDAIEKKLESTAIIPIEAFIIKDIIRDSPFLNKLSLTDKQIKEVDYKGLKRMFSNKTIDILRNELATFCSESHEKIQETKCKAFKHFNDKYIKEELKSVLNYIHLIREEKHKKWIEDMNDLCGDKWFNWFNWFHWIDWVKKYQCFEFEIKYRNTFSDILRYQIANWEIYRKSPDTFCLFWGCKKGDKVLFFSFKLDIHDTLKGNCPSFLENGSKGVIPDSLTSKKIYEGPVKIDQIDDAVENSSSSETIGEDPPNEKVEKLGFSGIEEVVLAFIVGGLALCFAMLYLYKRENHNQRNNDEGENHNESGLF